MKSICWLKKKSWKESSSEAFENSVTGPELFTSASILVKSNSEEPESGGT